MNIANIHQLAQVKLSAERLRADPNLLLIVGHANLVQYLVVRLVNSEEEETQKGDKELPTSNIRADRWDTHSKQLCWINRRVATFTIGRVPVCSTYAPVFEDEEDEEDKEGEEGKVLASISLDQYFEAAGFTFNK